MNMKNVWLTTVCACMIAGQSGMATQQVTLGQVKDVIQLLGNLNNATQHETQNLIRFMNTYFPLIAQHILNKTGNDPALSFDSELIPNPYNAGVDYSRTILNIQSNWKDLIPTRQRRAFADVLENFLRLYKGNVNEQENVKNLQKEIDNLKEQILAIQNRYTVTIP